MLPPSVDSMTTEYVYIYSIQMQRSTFTVPHELTKEQARQIATILAKGDDIDHDGLVYLHATIENGEYVRVT